MVLEIQLRKEFPQPKNMLDQEYLCVTSYIYDRFSRSSRNDFKVFDGEASVEKT